MSQDAERIDMRVFRYGGVNVTYFVPSSSMLMNMTSDELPADRLSLPSVKNFILINISND